MAAAGKQPIRKYAAEQTAARLESLARQMSRGGLMTPPKAVHDLRVSIRRFLSCLDVFGSMFPKPASRKVRGQLENVMALAGEVRDRDIAADLAREAGLSGETSVVAELLPGRLQAAAALRRVLARLGSGGAPAHGRSQRALRGRRRRLTMSPIADATFHAQKTREDDHTYHPIVIEGTSRYVGFHRPIKAPFGRWRFDLGQKSGCVALSEAARKRRRRAGRPGRPAGTGVHSIGGTGARRSMWSA